VSLPPIVATKAKAIVAAVISAVTIYAYASVETSTAVTLHGLIGAAIGALVAFTTVHKVANRPTAFLLDVHTYPPIRSGDKPAAHTKT
jgi:hypothetical protein